jgi:glycosyltransferase involved in cell wall biosynthesis
VLVDVSAIIRHDAQTGIQRVVRAVWSELRRRSGSDFEVRPVFATAAHGYCYAPDDFLARRQADSAVQPVRVRDGDKFLGLDLSAHLLPKYRQQLRAWREHGATTHLVVYDLLPLQRPEWFTPAASANFGRWFDVLADQADQALCISDQVARDLSERFKAVGTTRTPAICRVQLGADIAASVPSAGVCDHLKHVLEHVRFRPAILMVGTVEPRKGYEAALSAFDYLWRTRLDAPDLVLVGRPGWKTGSTQARIRNHPQFGRRIHWFEQMSDEGLCLLYDGCRGVLMASQGEGWGLPLVEAAAHRKHVLARDLPVFREQRLSNVLYFGDDTAAPFADRLMDLVRVGEHPAPITSLPNWSDCVDGWLKTIGIGVRDESVEELPLRKAS